MTICARRPLLAATLTALLAASGCSASGAKEATSKATGTRRKNTMLTGFGKLGQNDYLFLGRDRGWFAEQGIDLDIQAGAGEWRGWPTRVRCRCQVRETGIR